MKVAGSMPSTNDFLIAGAALRELKKYAKLLTKAQQSGLNAAIRNGGGLHIRPTVEQRGGFLGNLLASLGIPLVVSAVKGLFGKGLHVGQGEWRSPPFIGSWSGAGMGMKKIVFEVKALSNHDLEE